MLYELESGYETVHHDGTPYMVHGMMCHNPKALVLLAETQDGEKVVLKKFKEEGTGERFFRNAQHAAQLLQEHSVAAESAGLPRVRYCDHFFQVVDYFDGMDAWYAHGRIPFTILEIRDLMAAVTMNIEPLSLAGLVHRDVKPDNVILANPNSPFTRENVKMIDQDLLTHVDDTASMAFGSPFFIAPENIPRPPRISSGCVFKDKERVISGKPHSTSDYYSVGLLGCSLFPPHLQRLISPHPPETAPTRDLFKAKADGSLFYPNARERVERKFLPRVAGENRRTFRAVIDTVLALAKTDPTERLQTAQEIHQSLEDTGNIIEV